MQLVRDEQAHRHRNDGNRDAALSWRDRLIVRNVGTGETVPNIILPYDVDAPGNGLEVDGRTLTGPYWLTAIGDPQTMRTALNIPGGVVDRVHNAGGNVIVNEPGTVRVSALHQAGTPRYARPAG